MFGDECADRGGFQHMPLADDHQIVGGEGHFAHQMGAHQKTRDFATFGGERHVGERLLGFEAFT